MPPRWGTPATVERKPLPGQVGRTVRRLALATLALLLLARFRGVLVALQLLPAAGVLHSAAGTALYGAAAVLGVLALSAVAALPEARKRPDWEGQMSAAQRKLLGLAPAPLSAAAPKPTLPAVQARSPSLGPPVRGTKASSATPQSEPPPAVRRSPAWSTGRPSPLNSRHITTPEQLRRVLDEFEAEATAGSPGQDLAAAAAATPDTYGYTSGASLFASPASAGGIPYGAAAPTYRPSAVPKGAAALPVQSDGKVTPSSQESRRALLERLNETERSLEAGTDRLREWMASTMLKPLVRCMDSAHTSVVESAARLGWTGIQLVPLVEAQAGKQGQADDELVVAQMREVLVGKIRALGVLQPPPPEATACLEAVTTYSKLSALLRGEYPAGLLPPTPQGYVASRVRELAEGTCMMDFEWSSGGRWGGKSWTADLPTDSALVLYLFAAFLAAPQWLFPQTDDISSIGGTLVLGKVPSRAAGGYLGILPTRPPQSHKATAVVGLQLASPQPLFSLLITGDPVFTASGSTAVFQVLLLFLRHIEREADGMVGGRSLSFFRLATVLKADKPSFLSMGSAARLLSRYIA